MALEASISLNSDFYTVPVTGRAITLGYIYVGTADTDPSIEANRVTVTIIQEDGTRVPILPEVQPLTIVNGRIVYNGSVVKVVADDTVSIKVTDKLNNQLYYIPQSNNYPLADDLADTATGKGASLVAVEDAQGLYDGDNVEAVLAEIKTTNYDNKADAVTHAPVNNAMYFIGGTDGGWFKGVTGAAAATYSDNGGSYCGTQFIPTGDDGSAAWVRVDGGYNVGLGYQPEWFGAKGDDSNDDTVALQTTFDAASSSVAFAPTLGNIGKVAIGAGIYRTTAELTINSFVSIVGASQGSMIKMISGTGFALRTADNADLVTVEKLNIQGNNNTTSDGGLLIGNLSTDSGYTAYCAVRDVTIRGFSKIGAIALSINNPSHVDCSNVDTLSTPNGTGLRLRADMVGTGVINFSGCKFGEYNGTDVGMSIEVNAGGRMDDISFNACFFGGQSSTGIVQLKTPEQNPATDRYRNHHNIGFYNCHIESGSASALGPAMLVQSCIGLIIEGFQIIGTNHLAGADHTCAIKFENTGWIKDVHVKGLYASNLLSTGNTYEFDFSGAGTVANLNLEESEKYDSGDVDSFDTDESTHHDLMEITNVPRIPTNWVKNGSFSAWATGSTSLPDFWIVSTDGTGSITRSSDSIYGSFSAQIKMATGTYYILYQDVKEYLYYRNRTVTLTAWVKTDINAQFILDDGVSAESSITLDTGNTRNKVSITKTISATATRLRAKLYTNATSTDGVRVDGVTMTAGGQESRDWQQHPTDYTMLQRTVTWNPISLVDGAGETLSVTVAGAEFGDFVQVAAPYDLQDITVTGYVQSADTVEVRLQNESTNVIDLASGSWTVRVNKNTP